MQLRLERQPFSDVSPRTVDLTGHSSQALSPHPGNKEVTQALRRPRGGSGVGSGRVRLQERLEKRTSATRAKAPLPVVRELPQEPARDPYSVPQANGHPTLPRRAAQTVRGELTRAPGASPCATFSSLPPVPAHPRRRRRSGVCPCILTCIL